MVEVNGWDCLTVIVAEAGEMLTLGAKRTVTVATFDFAFCPILSVMLT
jgi:hypothetical protein